MVKSLRILFAGTPDFAARHLQALLDAGLNVIGVYTQPDRPAGRGNKLTASPVKQLAESHQLPVYQPASLRNAAEQQALAALDADLMIVVAYGLLLPKPVLDAPRLGCINVHGSLLPRWRGAAPRITSYNVCYTKLLREPIRMATNGSDMVEILLEKLGQIYRKRRGDSRQEFLC